MKSQVEKEDKSDLHTEIRNITGDDNLLTQCGCMEKTKLQIRLPSLSNNIKEVRLLVNV